MNAPNCERESKAAEARAWAGCVQCGGAPKNRLARRRGRLLELKDITHVPDVASQASVLRYQIKGEALADHPLGNLLIHDAAIRDASTRGANTSFSIRQLASDRARWTQRAPAEFAGSGERHPSVAKDGPDSVWGRINLD